MEDEILIRYTLAIPRITNEAYFMIDKLPSGLRQSTAKTVLLLLAIFSHPFPNNPTYGKIG
jgi:hypothetical protein